MKSGDVKSRTYIDSSKNINYKDPKFQIWDIVRISKYKSIFAKDYTPNWSEEGFGIKKLKNNVPWTLFVNDVNGEEIVGTFYENELWKANQKEFRTKKLINWKGDKLYVKWKGYNNYFNSWINEKDII